MRIELKRKFQQIMLLLETQEEAEEFIWIMKLGIKSPHCQIETKKFGYKVVEIFEKNYKPEPCCEHSSDCAVHNMPAYPNGPCSCGAEKKA